MSRASTAGAFRSSTRDNSRIRMPQNAFPSQDKFLPEIIELENKGYLEEQTASLLKTLVLEENVEVFKVINMYHAKLVT